FRRDPRVRYRRLERGATIGAKRSVACEMARGEICLNWDDDDWHGPSRITRQVEALLGTDASASGLAGVFLYDPLSRRAWQDRGPEPPDGTMAYTRASWRRRPFPDSSDPGVLGRRWGRGTYAAACGRRIPRSGWSAWTMAAVARHGTCRWTPRSATSASTGACRSAPSETWASSWARATSSRTGTMTTGTRRSI